MADTVQISLDVDPRELWSNVMGGGWWTWSWWRGVEYLHGADWDTPGRVRLKIDSPTDDGKILTRTLTVNDLARGVAVAMQHGYGDPLTGQPVTWVADYDAVLSDIVLQCAIFGKAIYG